MEAKRVLNRGRLILCETVEDVIRHKARAAWKQSATDSTDL